MATSPDWRPRAAIDVLKARARLMAHVRRFFDGRGYFEVDTPLLSRERVIDANLEPFVALPERAASAELKPEQAPALFLQTSPEFAMKRLVAAGSGSIYQLGHVFREGEQGGRHNSEFMMLEWYGVGDTHWTQMQLVEELVESAFAAMAANLEPGHPLRGASGTRPRPYRRTTYRDAFRRHAGDDLAVRSAAQLAAWSGQRQLVAPPGLAADDRNGWLNWLLAELIEPELGIDCPEFLIDYPPTQASLARIRADDPPVAERFELYIAGIELCNGYHELPDAGELRRRIASESERRASDGLPPLPVPERLLAAMEAGLPACAGVALGFDRLLMLTLGAATLDEVLPMTFDNC